MNEKSSLLSKTLGESGYNADDDEFPVLERRRESFSQMKKVTHNDPSLSRNFGSVEDFQKTLLGSTSVLKNAIDQKLVEKGESEIRRRSGSFTMLLQTAKEVEEGESSSPPPDHVGFAASKHSGQGNDDKTHVMSRMSMLYKNQVKKPSTLYLKKIKTSFFHDAKSLAEGTIPQSIVLAIVIGVVCGVAAYLYYTVLNLGLDYLWKTLPETYVIPSENWSPEYYWLWIPLVTFTMVTLVGLTVVYMGEPGDLPYTISRVHSEAYIPMNHVSPMVFASMFSILGKKKKEKSSREKIICRRVFYGLPFSICVERVAGMPRAWWN